MDRVLISKEDLLKDWQPKVEKEMAAELRKAGIQFRLLDLEWTLDGIVLYYDQSLLKSKAKRK